MDYNKIADFLHAVNQSEVMSNNGSLEVLLRKLHEWTAPWGGPVEELDNAGQVLYALDPVSGQWCAAGVPFHDVALWEALDVSPEVAGRWIAAGLGVEDVTIWADASDINNVDPLLVASWVPFAGVDIDDLVSWVSRGIGGVPGAAWYDAGWSNEWSNDVAKWIDAFGDFDPVDVYVNYSQERSVDFVRKWTKYGIIGEELESFDGKGYTPEEAAELQAEGVSGKDAPVNPARNDRLAAQVPGRSWSIIWKKAQERGWDMERVSTDPRLSDSVGAEIVRRSDGVKARVWFWNGKFQNSEWNSPSRLQMMKMRDLLTHL
jgi:hypothetical protein